MAFCVFALIFLCIFGFLASRISFEEDITKLIPKSERSDDTAKVLGQLNFADKITVIFNVGKDGSAEDLTEMATVFLDSLKSCDNYVNSVQGKVDDENIQQTFDFVYNNLPLFLDEKIMLPFKKNFQTTASLRLLPRIIEILFRRQAWLQRILS